jgi:hypothetical protein
MDSDEAPHRSDEAAIEEAARWLRAFPRCAWPNPIVARVRETFNLTSAAAIEAIRRGNQRGVL